MSDITVTHDDLTQIHVSLMKIQTLQAVGNKEFEDHKMEDKVHFDRIYDKLEEYVVTMAENTSALKIFETKVLAWVTGISVTGIVVSAVVNLYLKVPGIVG